MPYKRLNSKSIKFQGTSTEKILISQGADREKLNFGQDGDTELPFSISAWVFIKDVADTAGIIAEFQIAKMIAQHKESTNFFSNMRIPGQLAPSYMIVMVIQLKLTTMTIQQHRCSTVSAPRKAVKATELE